MEKVIELFPIYPFDLPASRIYAELWADLMKKGAHIGSHDLLIASTALSIGFSVAGFNRRHFETIEGLDLQILRHPG